MSSPQQVCLAIADAQREYVARRPMGGDLPEYAVKARQRPRQAKWPLLAHRRRRTTQPARAARRVGGCRRIRRVKRLQGRLRRHTSATATGCSPPRGRTPRAVPLDYLVDGRLIGGFAVVAYPAQYGNSGIMTFITNHDGVVYQRDLGPGTQQIAQGMTTFDPGDGWTKSTDASRSAREIDGTFAGPGRFVRTLAEDPPIARSRRTQRDGHRMRHCSNTRAQLVAVGACALSRATALALWLALSGCQSIGPETVSRDRSEYASSISESWKRQTLLHIVKLRYLRPADLRGCRADRRRLHVGNDADGQRKLDRKRHCRRQDGKRRRRCRATPIARRSPTRR